MELLAKIKHCSLARQSVILRSKSFITLATGLKFLLQKVSRTLGTSFTLVENEQRPESGLLNKSSRLAPALGVTKLIIVTDVILVIL
jgi:hypothetical protein